MDNAAFHSGELTQASYEEALREGDTILKELTEDIPATEAKCARIRAYVEEILASK